MSSGIDRFPGGTPRSPAASNAGRFSTIAPGSTSPIATLYAGRFLPIVRQGPSRCFRGLCRPHSPRRKPISRHEELENRTRNASGPNPRFVPPIDGAESILVLLIPAKQVHRPKAVRSRALNRFVEQQPPEFDGSPLGTPSSLVVREGVSPAQEAQETDHVTVPLGDHGDWTSFGGTARNEPTEKRLGLEEI